MASTPQHDLRRIGAVLRDHRERALLGRDELAEKASLSPHTIKDIELGKVRASRLAYLRIGAAVGIDADAMDILTGSQAGVA